MKKIMVLVVATFAVVLFGVSYTAFAHPGKTDSSGGHHCWTNCSKWGYSYGEYHYHNGGGVSYTPSYDSAPTYSIPSCPSFSSYDSLSQTCQCSSGYFVKGDQCVGGDTICKDQFGSNSKYDSLKDSCVCRFGYEWNSAGTACVNKQSNYYYDSILLEDLLKQYQEIESQSKCGNNSEETGDGNCRCISGYIWENEDPDDLDCVQQVLTCGDNQYLGTDNLCYCNSGYFFNTKKDKCEKYNTAWCQTQFGKNVSYNKTTSECICKTGYLFDSKKSKCVKPSTSWCKTMYGKNISYDKTAGWCVCGKGYSFDSTKNKCVKVKSK